MQYCNFLFDEAFFNVFSKYKRQNFMLLNSTTK